MSKWILGVVFLCLCFSLRVHAKVSCEQPNGENGYYTKSPRVTIEHEGKGKTKYRLKNASGRIWTGEVSEQNPVLTLQQDNFIEGSNYLDVWMEDEHGNIQEASIQQIKIRIDQTAPQYPLQFKEGAELEITAVDLGSGVAGIYCSIEGKETQYVMGNQAFISLPENFSGKVRAYAVDRAGNAGAYCYYEKNNVEVLRPVVKDQLKKEEEDLEAPVILLEGFSEVPILREARSMKIVVKDNVLVEKMKCMLQRKNQDEMISYELSEWKYIDQEYVLQYELNEDGIYEFSIEAADAAGNTCVLNRQIVLDSESPVLVWQKNLDGSTFFWKPEEMLDVKDLTTCFYEVRVDGILHAENQRITKAGKHRLQVRVCDLAGNQSIGSIDFCIREQRNKDLIFQEKIKATGNHPAAF